MSLKKLPKEGTLKKAFQKIENIRPVLYLIGFAYLFAAASRLLAEAAGTHLIYTSFLINLVLAGVVFYVVRPSPRSLLWAMPVLGALVYFCPYPNNAPILWLVGLGIPLVEELVFRVGVHAWAERSTNWNFFQNLVIQSFFFSLVHGVTAHPYWLPNLPLGPLLLGGFCYALWTQTRHLGLIVLVHGICNLSFYYLNEYLPQILHFVDFLYLS